MADDIKTKGLAILKDYIAQMRAAGYNDKSIKDRLIKSGSFTIPNQLPQNFGQVWAGGMADEFQSTANPVGIQNNDFSSQMPTPDNYMEYMSGSSVNRIPSYSEFTQFKKGTTGKFKQTRLNNIMTALQNKLKNYSGPKVGASQLAYEMGMVGLPQVLGEKWIPEYTELTTRKTDEAKKQADYEDLVMQYPEIEFKPGATVTENAKKIRDYNNIIASQKAEQEAQEIYQKETKLPAVVSAIDNAVYQATLNNEKISVEDVINTALQLGIELTFDQASAIFTSAVNRAKSGG